MRIDLINGLDGLAAGVSAIAIITITFIALQTGRTLTVIIGLIAIRDLGFIVYNFHPAKIFLGDSGALFLGYVIAVLSLMGFKSITFFLYHSDYHFRRTVIRYVFCHRAQARARETNRCC